MCKLQLLPKNYAGQKPWGEAVGMNRLNIDNYTGGTGYLGKDIMGSVRGITDEYGVMEERYEYDAFGNPYRGEMNNGVGLGYMGKPYDVITGLYNYGYRDYSPVVARFTTEDPIRDGVNWFAYVNNDPVNWIDLWGLRPLTVEEIKAHANASNSPVDYNKIDLIDGMPTYKEVRSIAEKIGIDTSKIADYQIQDWIENAVALSMPNGTIYVPSALNNGIIEHLLSTVHEIEHQAQFQNNDTKQVVMELMKESQMPNRTAYSTSGTWEYKAEQVEIQAKQQLSACSY
jgi:RHS repeat-associated protein